MTEKEKNSAVFPEKIRKFFRNRIQSIRLGAKIAFSPKKTNLEQIEKALPEYNLMKVFCETIPDAALLVKPDGEISFANKKFAARFDKDATEIIGKKIMELFSTEAAKKRMDKIQKAIEKKATVHFYDEWHDRILKNSVSPVINEKNDVIALAIVSHDITEYRKLISEFAEALDENKTLLKEEKSLTAKLQEALAKIETLSGILPICMHCKKIRDDRNYWQQLEKYIRDHSEAEFSHSICPDCKEEFYPSLKKK